MKVLAIILCMTTFGLSAQSITVKEEVSLDGQDKLDLELAFADVIVFNVWDKNEILVEAEVEINGGEDNDVFEMNSSFTSITVFVEMDEEAWKRRGKQRWNKNCNWESTINYQVYLPKEIKVRANSISGDYEYTYYGTPYDLKTISGAIDITVPQSLGLDFAAKTISGEIYSDIDIEFPYGKEGLRQIVGQDIKGRISQGGKESNFETISGNIYLRRG